MTQCRGLKAQVVLLTAAWILTMMPCFAGAKVPLRSGLKTRVSQFYAAYVSQDWPALLELTAPFVRECDSAEDLRLGWTEDGLVKVLSWRIVDIRYDESYLDEELKVECSGKIYRPEAGALVVTSQLDQKGEEKPQRGDHFLHWVLIEGTWFAVGPE